MKNYWERILFILLVLLINEILIGQDVPDRVLRYRQGDWVSYPVLRTITSLDLGSRFVYAGTPNGILRYDFFRESWEEPFTVSNGLENDHIRMVYYDQKSGFLWSVTDAGLSVYKPGADEWRNFTFTSLGVRRISLIGSGEQYLWLKEGDAYYRGDRILGIFRRSSAREAEDDDIRWYGSYRMEPLTDFFMEHGYFFYPDRNVIQRTDLREYSITETAADNFDHVWIGTSGLGLGIGDRRTFQLNLFAMGPYIPDVQCMAWDNEGMWMGGFSASDETGGITWWNMEDNQWEYFEAAYLSGLRSDKVTAIAPDGDQVWFGTNEGLALFNKNRNTWRVFSVFDNLWDDRITSVALSRDAVWVGTEYGINRILPGMVIEKVMDKGLIHRFIYQLEADSEDIWAGTDQGIFYYTAAKEKWEPEAGYGGMLELHVTAISVFGDEAWFGTDDGIEVYNKKDNNWQGYPKEHFPTGGTIHTLLADTDAVWAGTDHGAIKFIRKENRWRRFTTEDGLLDNMVNWILLDGDYIWFGTKRGLSRFYWNTPYRID